jgi:hypothetical protein
MDVMRRKVILAAPAMAAIAAIPALAISRPMDSYALQGEVIKLPFGVEHPEAVKQLYWAMNSMATYCDFAPPIMYAPTGEEYVECVFGVNLHQVEEEDAEAVACWDVMNHFMAELRPFDRKASLYWRVKPEFFIGEISDSFDLWRVPMLPPGYPTTKRVARFYARYLISSAPVLSYDADELLRLRRG